MRELNRIIDIMWPGVVTVPVMTVGGTDGRYLRIAGIPTYGVQGFFQDRDDVRSHGRNERMPVTSFYEGQPSSTSSSKPSRTDASDLLVSSP